MEADNEKIASEGKNELIKTTSALLPKGRPDFRSVVNYPMICDLVTTEGKKTIHKAILLLIKDLCNSLNLVRNMTEGQMIEAAAFLLEECGNFRLEDYLMMFAMMKRGKLVKIMDRVDVQIIGQALDEYWLMRNQAGERIQGDRQDLNTTAITEGLKSVSVLEQFQKIEKELAEEKRKEREEDEAKRRQRNARLEEIGFRLGEGAEQFCSEVVSGFCDLYIAGKATSPVDLQFYENNKEAIEKELKRRAAV